jgi:hypothetical protein
VSPISQSAPSTTKGTTAKYAATFIVLTHFGITLVHGLAHRSLRIDLSQIAAIFIIVAVVLVPLGVLPLVWTGKQRLGLILLLLSMAASFLFGLDHHFFVMSPDHVHAQPTTPWGMTFVLTAYGLLLTEAIGTYVGIHFLRFHRAAQ